MGNSASADEVEPLKRTACLYNNPEGNADEDAAVDQKAGSRSSQEPRDLDVGAHFRCVALVALALQTTFQVFVIKYANLNVQTQYLNTSVVLFVEMLKTLICFVMEAYTQGSLSLALTRFVNFAYTTPLEAMKCGLPAIFFWMQSYFMFYSLDKLSMAVQQATYQLKIFTTAVLSIIVLGRKVTLVQWSAIFLLIVGVVLVHLPNNFFIQILDGNEANGLDDHVAKGNDPDVSSGFSFVKSDAFLGVIAVLLACICSGGGGVYMEKLLKQYDQSLWFWSVFVGVFGSIAGLAGALIRDGQVIVEQGFCVGFTWKVHVVIWTVSTGGLLCACVIKYTDTILRQFSTAVSILLTIALSAWVLHDVVLGVTFCIGSAMVIGATFMYNLGLPEWFMQIL